MLRFCVWFYSFLLYLKYSLYNKYYAFACR